MAFMVQDFHDLVRLIDQHPEWRAELRRLVLTEELLGLPTIVRELAEAQRQTQTEVGELRQTVQALAEAQQRTAADVAELRLAMRDLVVAQRRTAEEVGELARAQNEMRIQVDKLRGDFLEIRYERRASGYFGRLLRRVRIVSSEELDQLLDAGLAAKAIDDDAAHDIRLADLIVRGRRPAEERDTYLVVEVSAVVDPVDVERAVRRAAALGKALGAVRAAVPVVAGERLTPEAERLTKVHDVWTLLNGRVDTAEG